MQATSEHRKRPAPRIDDIPGEDGWPIIGNTFKILACESDFAQRMNKTYGPVYRTRAFFQRQVTLLGPEANEFVLLDRERNFSSEGGWNPYLGKLFPRGLMLMDFDQHRRHRSIMQIAFKASAMRRYIDTLNDGIPERLAHWATGEEILFYPAIKKLTLDMASRVFLGIEDPAIEERVNRALTAMVQAAIAVVRLPLPGSLYWRGLKGRRFMTRFLLGEIPKRRGADQQDMFTLLCNATDADGSTFSDQEIVDHMNFLWMAAHDTITSSVTTLVYELGRHADWQSKLREECNHIAAETGSLPYERLADLKLVEYAFKEALRLNAPVPVLPRKAVRDTAFGGYVIPAGTPVSLSPIFTHYMPEIWPDPKRFDPMRFSEAGGAKDRHKFAWIPFGGGAHMCIGLHFAHMQAKVIIYHLLTTAEISLRPDYKAKWQIMPLTKPRDGLPVTITPLAASRSGQSQAA